MAIQLKKILPLVCALLLFAPLFADAFVIGLPPNNLGLVGYWSFNEGSGTTVADHSGNSNTGTLVNSPAWVSGRLGTALNFVHSSQQTVALGTKGIPTGNSPYTISAWIKPTAMNDEQGIVGWGDYGSDNSVNALRLTGSGIDNYWWGEDLLVSTPSLVGAWHMVTATFDGTTRTIYLDGVAVGSDTPSVPNAATNADPEIGRTDAAYNEYFDGDIDEVRIYSRALSSTEVAALYGGHSITVNAGSSGGNGLSGSLTASWSFDASTVSGTTVDDLSGNGHNLTLENGASISPGYEGDALTLNGTNQYAAGEVGTLPTSVALSMWVKANDVSTEQSILVEQDSEVANTGYHFTLVGILGGAFYAGFWNIGDIASSPISAGEWYHVILTYDGVANTQSLYVNGVLQGTQSGTWSPPSTIYFLPGLQQQSCSFTNSSGHCGDLAHYFNGQIDDLQAYDQAFTSSDVAELSGSTATFNASSVNLTDGSTLGSGLVGLWTFDGKDMYQNVADESGTGDTGYLMGFTSTTSAETIGKLGQALKFNGSSSYVTLPSLPSLSNYTISFWAKPSNCGSSSEVQFFDSPGDNIGVSCKTGGVIANWAGGGSYPVTGSNVWKNGTWIYITVTSQGGTNKLYVNGALNTTGTAGNTFGSGTGYIGQVNGGGRYYGGIIDDFRLYNRALSASEVQQLYDLGE